MSSGTGTILVDRCICRDMAFKDLLRRARPAGWSLIDLMGETGAGAQCGLCRPYLRRMLQTGETEFHQLIVENEPPRDARGDA
jgi:bacterioferritin-associated ferredoxin